jgi:hypothetical protein
MTHELTEWATTARELEVLEALVAHGSNRKAGAALGISKSAITSTLERLRARQARTDISAHRNTEKVPPGFAVKGTTTLQDHDGKVRMQWVKTDRDAEKQAELMRLAVGALCEEIPRLGTIKPISGTLGHLCNVYTLTDSHVGMLAWDGETQSGDWDLKTAEETLTGCFAAMIANSPKAGTCVVAQLGDFLHYDGHAPVTPTNAHVLDADSRFAKMVKIAIRILRRVIDMALQRHDKVIVLMAEGNHDLASSVWLRAMFAALYEKEPRIQVIDSELPYYTYQHGETMLAWHHGHLKKLDGLPLTFAAQFPKMWGGTTKRYCHTGHRHHVEEKEHSGMTVIQHATLAARDAYAARGGWIANRQVTSITYSDKFGQVARNTVTPEMLPVTVP